jgi:hypothetical protein
MASPITALLSARRNTKHRLCHPFVDGSRLAKQAVDAAPASTGLIAGACRSNIAVPLRVPPVTSPNLKAQAVLPLHSIGCNCAATASTGGGDSTPALNAIISLRMLSRRSVSLLTHWVARHSVDIYHSGCQCPASGHVVALSPCDTLPRAHSNGGRAAPIC